MKSNLIATMIGLFSGLTVNTVSGYVPEFTGEKGQRSKYFPHQGKQETARRRRQLMTGFIKA